MENTYTYTARSAVNPENVVTFTLHDSWMSVGPGAPVEQVERVLKSESQAGEKAGLDVTHRLWLKPLAISLLERGTRPFHIVDVDASLEDGRLNVRAWLRTGGLRLFPISLITGRVDNPEAAQAFIHEVDRRQTKAGRPGILFGWLDYWATWLITGVALIWLLEAWRRSRRGATE
ncbi:MAG: hypothetical protein PVI59_11085 [Anaerolineae bacterium]